ncbi:MAG TPA: tetratricopeptide repeat protein [Steroidobacteraceae bacterium]|nr:tetratricopeptide repeat protein [Steroidobacteraceae bacterium]
MSARPGVLGTLVFGLAVAGAVGLSAVQPAAAAEKDKNVVSRELAKPLKAAQDAMQAKPPNLEEAVAKLKEAEANPKKTPYDEHIINVMAGSAYARLNDYASAEKAFEAQVNDGFTDQADLPRIVKAVAQINYQLKDYDKAIEYGNKAIQGGYEDDDIDTLVGQSYYLKKDYANTMKFEQALVEKKIKAGAVPPEQPLKLWVSACVNLQDTACTNTALEKVVTYYPSQEYWKQLLYQLAQDKSASSSDRTTLQFYRLMSDVDVLSRPQDYTEMAQLALAQGSPGEAEQVLEKGIQKGVFTDAHTKETSEHLLDTAKKAAVSDQASLPRTEKDADNSATGDKYVGVGFAYLGYGQYDKASDLLAKGLSKGHVKNEPEARLLLGIAQLKAGHKDQAVQTFQAVKGDPTLEHIAALWSLHAKQA